MLDMFYAADSGLLCKRAKQTRRDSAEKATERGLVEPLTVDHARILKAKVRRPGGSPALPMWVRHPQRLPLRNQHLGYKISTTGMYLSAKKMVAQPGALLA